MTTLSLIVCTRDRAASLQVTLAALAATIAATKDADVEVVLVDNGSTDATPETMAAWARTVRFPVHLVSERRAGLAVARNAGVRAAGGRILVFTDDDCRPAADFLSRVLHHYATGASPCIRGGRVEPGDPRDLPLSLKREAKPERLVDGAHPATILIGANMTMHRAVFDRVGLFDERFGAGAPFRAGEETDLLYRAHLAGIAVEYQPDMVVHHYHGRRDLAGARAQCRAYYCGGGAFYMKHITRPLILRCLYWTLRNWLRELLGGPPADAALGISNRAILAGNLIGMVRFLTTPRPRAQRDAA